MAEIVEEDGELVAAEAGDHVAFPQARFQPLSDRHQEGVADQMSETVVDELEPVEIEKQDREDIFGMALGSVDNLPEQLDEERSIRKTGQRVVKRRVPELFLHQGPLGNIGL